MLVVKGKDFVAGRVWRLLEGDLLVAAASFDHSLPVTKGKNK